MTDVLQRISAVGQELEKAGWGNAKALLRSLEQLIRDARVVIDRQEFLATYRKCPTCGELMCKAAGGEDYCPKCSDIPTSRGKPGHPCRHYDAACRLVDVDSLSWGNLVRAAEEDR